MNRIVFGLLVLISANVFGEQNWADSDSRLPKIEKSALREVAPPEGPQFLAIPKATFKTILTQEGKPDFDKANAELLRCQESDTGALYTPGGKLYSFPGADYRASAAGIAQIVLNGRSFELSSLPNSAMQFRLNLVVNNEGELGLGGNIELEYKQDGKWMWALQVGDLKASYVIRNGQATAVVLDAPHFGYFRELDSATREEMAQKSVLATLNAARVAKGEKPLKEFKGKARTALILYATERALLNEEKEKEIRGYAFTDQKNAKIRIELRDEKGEILKLPVVKFVIEGNPSVTDTLSTTDVGTRKTLNVTLGDPSKMKILATFDQN